MMNQKSKMGVLLTNLGTPLAPTPSEVKKYLAEFLSDPFVVQIPKPIWWLILNGIILRIRPHESAKLYEKIWTSEGSPLLVFMSKILSKLKSLQENKVGFALGMRYGQPSLLDALKQLRELGVSQLIILPLYPQYSTTTTASTFNEIEKILQKMAWCPEIKKIHSYATESGYINTLASSIETHWQKKKRGQLLLFSFHGLPQKHILRGDPYFDQCIATAKEVALRLNLEQHQWTVVFQSRFGREKWLEPYCNEVLTRLPLQGIKQIDVICPGFSVDCLETLEEMAMTNKQLFLTAGGEAFQYIPALNDSDLHIAFLSELLSLYITFF